MNVKVGSRGGGQSARAKEDYIEREGKYEKDIEELEYSESGNMPEWAEADPQEYWGAADAHERANGSLYREVECALPRELNEQERKDTAREFAQALAGPEKLPYTMAIHKGGGDNPHMHLMISERGLDGHARDAETWFKRANTAEPEKGGAKKTRSMMGKEWLEQTREKWEQTANQALERAGRDERISSASLQDQFWNAVEGGDEQRAQQLEHRVPGVHRGPGAEERADRGDDRAQERLATAKDIEAVNSIARLEAKLAAVVEKIRDLAERIRPRKERTDALDSRDKAAFEKGQDARAALNREVARTAEAAREPNQQPHRGRGPERDYGPSR